VQYGGVPEGQQGPVLRHLLSYGPVEGWVVGRFGEMSDGLMNLFNELVESRVQALKIMPGAQSPGRRGLNRLTDVGLKGILMGQIRREMSLLAVRCQARLLLDRMEGLIGDGAREAVKRRDWAMATERALGLERRAQEVARRQGQAVTRRGGFKHN